MPVLSIDAHEFRAALTRSHVSKPFTTEDIIKDDQTLGFLCLLQADLLLYDRLDQRRIIRGMNVGLWKEGAIKAVGIIGS